MSELDDLKTALQALESARYALGDAATEVAAAALRERLATLEPAGNRAAEGERKQVTVMFADISGFTPLSEKVDAEDVRNLVNAWFEQVAQIATRYGGYIDKFIGDEMMVVFGAPVAMEDHAARALYAALEIQQALVQFNRSRPQLGHDALRLHFGINSGLVVAGAIGSQAKREYTVMGDTVNVAARLAARAKEGEVLTGETTKRLTGEGFEFEDLGPVDLKGISRSERLFSLRGASKTGAMHPVRYAAPLIGRGEELGSMQRDFLDVLKRSEPRSVAVIGPAGIGKSRLFQEFRNWAKAEHEGTVVLRGAASPHMTTTPYFTAGDLLRDSLAMGDVLSPVQMRSSLERTLKELAIYSPPRAQALALVMGADYPSDPLAVLSPEEKKNLLFASFATYIRAVASQNPTVLVFEDLHWIDDLSMEVVVHLFTELGSLPVLFMTLTRPILDRESSPRQAESQIPRDRHRRIMLGELSEEDSSRLVTALAPKLSKARELVEAIVRKGQGNPFFTEEIVGTLSDRGMLGGDGTEVGDVALEVPNTVWGVLAERIDRLPGDQKRVLQSAAVVGRVFWPGAVSELAEIDPSAQLGALNQRDFVHPVGQAVIIEDWEWMFRHILVQEVAYSGLLREKRKAAHLRAARWLERRLKGRPGEYASLLALHYREADDWAKTAEFAEMAGDRASSIFANREAKNYYSQALEALSRLVADGELDRRKIDVTLKLARAALQRQTDDVYIALEAAQALASELNDADRQVRVMAQIASWLYIAGQGRPAVEMAAKAVAFGTQAGLEELLAVPYTILGRAMYLIGEYAQSAAMLEKWKSLAEKFPEETDASAAVGLGSSLSFLAIAYHQLGQIAKGDSLAEESIREAETKGDLRQIASAYLHVGATDSMLGRLERADEHLPRAVELLEQTGDLAVLHVGLGLLGYRHAQAGQLEEAKRCADRALALASEMGSYVFVPVLQAIRAEIDLQAGRPEEAEARAREAVRLAQETRQRMGEGEGRRVLGWAIHYSRPEARQEAERELRTAVDVHRQCNGRVLAARGLYQLADYLHLASDVEGAKAAEAEASAICDELGLDWLPLPSPARQPSPPRPSWAGG